MLTGKSFTKIRKTVYEIFFRKPFSKSVRLSVSALFLCLYSLSLSPNSCQANPSHPQPLWPLLSFSRSTNNPPLRSLTQKTPLKHEQKLKWPKKHDDRGEVRSCEMRHGAVRRGERARSHELVFFLRFTRSIAVGFDYCRFWVMMFTVMGFGVAGGLKLMGFGWFWAWFLVLCSGSQWVSGWVLGRFRWGFGSQWVVGWLTVGCGVAHSGFVGWLAVVVSIFGRFQWF